MAAEPTRQFLELLASAVASGRAHVADDGDDAPADASAWGWRRRSVGTGAYERDEWEPQGHRVGWLTSEGLFLDPNAAYAAAQAVGNATGDPLAVGAKTLAKRLDERGLLLSADRGRGRLTTRRTFGDRRPNVLHLRPDALAFEKSTQSTQSARSVPAGTPLTWRPAADGSIPWVDSVGRNGKSTRPSRPTGVAVREGDDG